MNILSLAIEIELRSLYPNGHNGTFALATAVYTRDTPTSEIRILDRIGRPEITNVSLIQQQGDADIRDRYNADRPFSVIREALQPYESRLVKNISYYDGLDQKIDWNDSDKNQMARLLADDFLFLDTTKPCSNQSFLEPEKALLKSAAHTTCGGRQPQDDIMDTLFTAYIAGPNTTVMIKDGVDAPQKAISNEFPHLAKPSLGLFDQLKARLARGALGL